MSDRLDLSPHTLPKCCIRCDKENAPEKLRRFIGCKICGCKRCPKASDHRLECTGSNEPGQPGSVYK